ncbi:hypothetical protein DFQ26_001863, partial [Actinomortierella ambigua]
TVTKTTVTTVTTGTIEKPAAPQKTSWFRRLASGAADAAGAVAKGATGAVQGAAHATGSVVKGTAGAVAGVATGVVATAVVVSTGALDKVDGVWKRTVKVLTTQKAHVDERAPMAKTSYVYYDDEDVFDAELVQKDTGVTYKTQLLFDTKTNAYYIYILHGEEVSTEGPFETIEQAKESFQIIYQKKTGVAWTERTTTVSEHWTYEVKTYETFEVEEEIEEIVEEEEVKVILEQEKTTTTEERTVTKDIEIITEGETVVTETTKTVVEEAEVVKTQDVVLEHKDRGIAVEVKETKVKKAEFVADDDSSDESDAEETVTKTTETTITVGTIEKPAVTQKTSWFRRLASGAADAAGAVAKGATGAVQGAAHATGSVVKGTAGAVAGVATGVVATAVVVSTGALDKVDGVWKRTV